VKKALLILLGVLVLGVVVFGSIRAGRRQKGVKVYAEAAKRRNVVEVVKSSGAIDPKEKVNISAHVVGKIEKLYVQEGDRIEAGQPFLKLEQQAYIAQRDQWAAQLRSAKTSVQKAAATLADCRIKLARAQSLNQQGILSKEQLEASVLQEVSARLSVNEADEAVREADANLVKANDDLVKTTIYAPLSGRVIKLNAEQGEVVVSGTMNNPGSVIGTIADLSEILAKVNVDETEVVHVRVGQTAILKVDAIPNRPYHGKIIEVGSSGLSLPTQPDVTFFEVKILLSDADEALRPGMSVRSEINAASHPSALAVPIQAVVERRPLAPAADAKAQREAKRGGGNGGRGGAEAAEAPAAASTAPTPATDEEVKVVFVVAGGKARQRPVETGISDETHVEILAGLQPGEQVVTGPYRTLRDLKDGDAVTVSTTSEAEDRRSEGSDKGDKG